MTEAAGSAQGSGQSSGSSQGAAQSSQGSEAQSGASDQTQQTQQTQNSGGQQQAPTRPAYVPEKFWDTAANTVKADDFTKHVNDLSVFKAEADVRAQAVPVSPDKYEIKLPEGFKPPEGMQFEFNADDPALIEARKAAHELKLDQAGFSRMLGIYAANKLGEAQAVSTAREAEMSKLGSTGPQRLEAIETWLNAKVGDKAKVLVATLKNYPVAANVEALEGVIRAFSSQGGGGVTQSGREGQDDAGKIPGYETMTFTQRRAAQMNQKFAGSR